MLEELMQGNEQDISNCIIYIENHNIDWISAQSLGQLSNAGVCMRPLECECAFYDPATLYHNHLPITDCMNPLLSCQIEADNLPVYSFRSAAAGPAADAAAAMHSTDSRTPLAIMH